MAGAKRHCPHVPLAPQHMPSRVPPRQSHLTPGTCAHLSLTKESHPNPFPYLGCLFPTKNHGLNMASSPLGPHLGAGAGGTQNSGPSQTHSERSLSCPETEERASAAPALGPG